jgi:hypothetical protein
MPTLDLLLLILTNSGIVLLLLIFLAWNLPEGALLTGVASRMEKPVIWLGLAHNWRMFAPRPVSGIQLAHFELVFGDGSVERFEVPFFPGPEGNPHGCNNRHLRLQHSLLTAGSSSLKPAFCNFVIAQYTQQQAASGRPAARVVEVRLICLRQPARPLGSRASPRPFLRSVGYCYRPPVRPATTSARVEVPGRVTDASLPKVIRA